MIAPSNQLNMRMLIFLLCLPTSMIFCQTHQLDSLEALYAKETLVANKLELLNEMVGTAFRVDMKLALGYAKRGVTLSEKTDNKSWQPKFYESRGRMHANLMQLDSASIFFDKAMTGYMSIDDKRGQATTSFKISWVSKAKGNIEEAMASDLKGLRMMESLDDQKGIADALGRVSEDLSRQGRQEEALEYAQRAIAICEKNELDGELTYALRYAGDACIANGDAAQALTYYTRALDLTRSLDFGYAAIADIVNSRGNALKRLGRYEEALLDYEECLDNSQKANYPNGMSTAIGNLGEVNLLLKNYEAALPYQLMTIEAQEKAGNNSNLTENYRHASTIYENKGDYKSALSYERKASIHKDLISSKESDIAISELRTQYETEKKEATISSQSEVINQQRHVQWLGLGVLGLLSFLAFTFFKNAKARKNTNDLLAAKNTENELLLREIHHRVKNNLDIVSSLLELQSSQIDNPDIKNAMQESQNRVQSIGIVHQKLYQRDTLAAIEMKDYFINLSEGILDSFGDAERVTIECMMDQIEVDIDTAVPLGLIVNELLTNTLKYAFPDGRKGHVKINLVRPTEDVLHLEVSDNGVGKVGITKGTGFGTQLVSMLTRQLRGSMLEKVENGTTIHFQFDLMKAV